MTHGRQVTKLELLGWLAMCGDYVAKPQCETTRCLANRITRHFRRLTDESRSPVTKRELIQWLEACGYTVANHNCETTRDLAGRLTRHIAWRRAKDSEDFRECEQRCQQLERQNRELRDQMTEAVTFLDSIKVWADWHSRADRLRAMLALK